MYRLKVTGQENRPKEGPVIYCGNHRSYLDPPLIVVTAGRHVRFMAKEELTKNKFLKFLGFVFDAIYVKRDNKEIGALKTTLKALKNKESIAMFPEGTRNGLEKGESIKEGVAFFVLQTGAKVQPVGITGGEKAEEPVFFMRQPCFYSGRHSSYTVSTRSQPLMILSQKFSLSSALGY